MCALELVFAVAKASRCHQPPCNGYADFKSEAGCQHTFYCENDSVSAFIEVDHALCDGVEFDEIDFFCYGSGEFCLANDVLHEYEIL